MSLQRFVIYTTPRSGAGYLLSMLNQVPGVSCHGDVFPAESVEGAKHEADEENYHEQLLRGVGEISLCGFCVTPFSDEEVFNETLHDPAVKKIVLERDLFSSYISSRQADLAQRSGLLASEAEQMDAKRYDRYGCLAHFDEEAFEVFRRRVTAFHRHIERVLIQTKQESLTLWYKGLCQGNRRQDVADFLGLDWPELSPEKMTVRMSSLPGPQRVDNPEEMKAYQERALWYRKPQLIPASPDIYLMPDGVRLILNTTLISKNIRVAILQGQYEKQEAKILRRTLKNGERYLEWGGGLGYLASNAALTGKCASITVVEASPDVYTYMKEILRVNQVHATTLNRLVGTDGADGESGTLYVNQHFWANSMVPGKVGKQKVQVEMASGNRLIREYRPTYLNCDIEGAEFEVFPELDLESVRKILVEVHEVPARGRTIDGFIHLLAQKGFVHVPKRSIDNVLFFRKKRLAWVPFLG